MYLIINSVLLITLFFPISALAIVSAPAAGYSGSQLFNIFGAIKEPGEPDFCGNAGGAPYWYSYQPPVDGYLQASTTGSNYDTILAAYYDTGNGTSFNTLVQVAADNNSGPLNTSMITFPVVANRIYYIIADGINGATGNLRISYLLKGTIGEFTPPLGNDCMPSNIDIGLRVKQSDGTIVSIAGSEDLTASKLHIKTTTGIKSVLTVPIADIKKDIPFAGLVSSISSPAGCIGSYNGYAKLTNDLGSFWISPPSSLSGTNAHIKLADGSIVALKKFGSPTIPSSATFSDMSNFSAPYNSVVLIKRKSDSFSWCNATNSITFPVSTTDQYSMTVYVKSVTPPPTVGQSMTLQVNWH
jgi:hypothetical protein